MTSIFHQWNTPKIPGICEIPGARNPRVTTTGPPPPVAQPTASPTVAPRAPPEDLVLLSPDELGVTILMHFKADVPAATTPTAYPPEPMENSKVVLVCKSYVQ